MLHEQTELTGTVHQGVIVIGEGVKLPEGQVVKIIVEGAVADDKPQAERKAASPLAEMLLKYAGVIDDLPADMAKNHDHYLYGAPKVDAEMDQ